ncbi:MAG TPA: bifunctional folylpolyglutamate synthase/dihydrofolate synthase, partial [Limnochordia bacterium]|nr:bifunctional folylpolyglutamate synthase/dihydrofolate synthase [Limnochordia bacterium]
MSGRPPAWDTLDAPQEPGGSAGRDGRDGPPAKIRALLAALGDPHLRLRVVHVAGSVGKGAVSLLIARALQASGRRVGLYTSPHLIRVEERFDLDGAPVASGRLAQILAAVDAQVPGEPPGLTPFERLTAAAFLLFAEEGVEWAVVEAGLGGRFDATNV